MSDAFTLSLTVTDNAATWSNSSERHQSASHNSSFGKDCIRIVFSEMEYLPWDNPDNIVSAEVEEIARRIEFNVLGLVFLIGGPANVINMVVFYKQGLKDRVNLCLFSLSLSDLLFLIFIMFGFGEQLHIQFTTKEQFGPMTTFQFNHNIGGFLAFGYVSGIISAIIAIERCLCVYKPLKFRRLLRTRKMGLIIVVVYIMMPSLFFLVVSRYRVKCMYDPTSGEMGTTLAEGKFYKTHKKFIDYLDAAIFGGGLPGIVLMVVTTTTVLTIVKLRQIVKWRSETSSSISTSELALTKMLVVNSILFIVCFSPEALNHLTRHFIPDMRAGGRYHNFFLTNLWIGDTFLLFNAAVNIFVYYAMGTRYRKMFWLLLGRKTNTARKVTEMSSVNTKSQRTILQELKR